MLQNPPYLAYSHSENLNSYLYSATPILLTANRSMKGEDSLEQVIREENTVDSLPVITIGDADRFLADRVYRNRCVDRILEILLDIETWMGVGRLFVP